MTNSIAASRSSTSTSGQQRPEQLLAGQLGLVVGGDGDRRAEQGAGRAGVAAAVEQQLGALGLGPPDRRRDPLAGRGRDQRADVGRGSSPAPTRSSAARRDQRLAQLASAAPSSPTTTQTEPARQRWPAAPKAEPMIAGSACSRSASGITISEFLAPPSACTRLPVGDAALGDHPRRLRLADEGDRVDPRVVEQRR